VTCSGGTLQIGGTAHITINTNAPATMGNYPFSAVVDPNNTIAERSEANNATSAILADFVFN
jgi:subtilase family serine protease